MPVYLKGNVYHWNSLIFSDNEFKILKTQGIK